MKYFEKFGKATGSKLNKEKTESICIGKWTPKEEQQMYGVDRMKILGIWISKEEDLLIEGNVYGQILKIRKLLKFWKLRRMSVYGRIVLVNTIALSKIWNIAQVLPIEEKIIKKLQREVCLFIWKSEYIEPIKRKTTFLTEKEGGFNVVDIAAKCKALFLMSLKNVITGKQNIGNGLYIFWLGISLRNENFYLAKTVMYMKWKDHYIMKNYTRIIQKLKGKLKTGRR